MELFTWMPIYKEIAGKLIEYVSDMEPCFGSFK